MSRLCFSVHRILILLSLTFRNVPHVRKSATKLMMPPLNVQNANAGRPFNLMCTKLARQRYTVLCEVKKQVAIYENNPVFSLDVHSETHQRRLNEDCNIAERDDDQKLDDEVSLKKDRKGLRMPWLRRTLWRLICLQ